ncbi:MAG: low temperature requirement protein A, partial [Actinomycetota bacterium]|nr:low temperature requirement protein A [Actinomycetota bacterium]
VAWYAAGNALGAVLWLASLLAPAPLLYVLWAVALSVELLAPILAVRTLDEPLVSFHPRHIAERYGLFTIIVLGESVLAVASGTAGTEWARAAVFTAALSFVVAACIWWIYFDYVEITGMELAPKPAFYWGYGHLAVYAAIAAFGVGAQLAIEGAAHVESAALAPAGGAGFGLAGRGILAGSVAVYLLAVSFVQYVNHHSLSERTALARLAVAAGLLILVILGGSLSPPVFAAAVALALAALTAFETVYAERFTQRSTENH